MTRRTAARIVKVARIFGLRRWAYRNVYLRSEGWKEAASTVRRIQDHCCAACHQRAPLDVHHLHYRTLGRESIRDGSIVGLCRPCHKRWEGRS